MDTTELLKQLDAQERGLPVNEPDIFNKTLPFMQTNAEASLQDLEKAAARTMEAKERLDTTDLRSREHGARCIALAARIAALDAELREESWSLGESFDSAGHSTRRRLLLDEHELNRSLQDFFSTYRRDAEMDAYLTAIFDESNAELRATSDAEILQRARTASLMGPILACEGGSASIGGKLSAELRQAVVRATQKVESARNALHEFRREAAKRQVAWQSKGMVTRTQTGLAVPKY
jgi:hypothetical protein